MTYTVHEPLSYVHACKTTVQTLGLAKNVEILDDFEFLKNLEAGRREEKQE